MFRPTGITNSEQVLTKNLKQVNFKERVQIEKLIDDLTASAKDPYAISLPMIMSAELGDEKKFEKAKLLMLTNLKLLDSRPETFPQWMQSNSFKAWMWGRTLLSADSMIDVDTTSLAKENLSQLLENKSSSQDNPAFYAWAWGYRAALNQTEYQTAKITMMDAASSLAAKSKGSAKHDLLSDALWAWVMNIQAAARAGDKDTYEQIKHEIKLSADAQSVTLALETGLLRTAESNDYPAWAQALVQRAAGRMGDESLYQDLGKALVNSSMNAEKADAKAEYALSILDGQLALLAQKDQQITDINSKPSDFVPR